MKEKITIFNKFRKKAILTFIASLFILSIFNLAFAVTTTVTPTTSCHPGQAKDFRELILNLVIGCVLSPLVYLIISFSIIVFLYGVFKFIKAEGDDKQAGREFIIWGIVGLFVMVSVWGLVGILTSTFNLAGTP